MLRKQFSNKEQILRKVAEYFGENAFEEKSWTNKETNEINKYNSLTDFYDKLNRLGKDCLLILLKKIKQKKEKVE